ncbi:unnamed protein product [Ectocarpus sp. 13 AM-2016]
MTLIGGCIRRYSLANGDAAGNSIGGPGFRSRALIPVALPRSCSPSGAILCNKWTVSNVPGPQEPVRLAGVGMKRIHFAFSNIMPQVGVVSLDGKISINFVVDPISVPDSFSLSAHFLDELEALAAGLGVEISGDMSALRTQADELTRVMEAALTAPMSY